MEEEFYRIKRLPPYVFSEVNTMKYAARSAGNDIIDFGMGNPDTGPAPHIIEKLIETIRKPRTQGYSTSKGIPGLRKAMAGYYQRRFDVTLDPETQIVTTIGSKEGLSSLATAITKPGDIVLVPNPNYPIHAYGFVIAGASIHYISRGPGYDFIKELEDSLEQCSPKPTAVVLNYPSNPTSECADLDFYEQVVDFCKFHNIYILSDIAYCEIYFDTPPPSILQVKGAMDIAVEFSSLSKTYSMAGWRVGFAAGNKHLIHALTRIKSYLDYGVYTPIQVAAIAALNGPQDCVDDLRKMYKARRDTMVSSFTQAGWPVPTPDASMFIWTAIPEQFKKMGSLEFSKKLLADANVAVAPGVGFGKNGEGFVRIALVENEKRIRQAARNIKQLLHP